MLLLIHRYAVPLLQQEKAGVRGREVGGKESALLIHRSAVPLLQQEKARTGGVQICLLRWEKVAAEADG